MQICNFRCLQRDMPTSKCSQYQWCLNLIWDGGSEILSKFLKMYLISMSKLEGVWVRLSLDFSWIFLMIPLHSMCLDTIARDYCGVAQVLPTIHKVRKILFVILWRDKHSASGHDTRHPSILVKIYFSLWTFQFYAKICYMTCWLYVEPLKILEQKMFIYLFHLT